ncbi:hypothetical protein M409DRAFT_20284 [Zasmidium cellare ATCC 36951]|uniref:Homeobox domain-containing protein n=1 Tax=Zasmidium cellare ATCC 36951 TaxID=1080233 RepID=A0A6A6CUL0_ZASCE|nr:uncharacterized protein M409DRAFT_20284 [Zasmidium cellare ATCC 36951]KAF2169870.1 hypothetical protein M409DRAFT_20284 [Zasmidium cellare ATCC 36951]
MDNETERSSASGSYAFLNHSTTTVPNNLPPSVDDKPLARQKRRRTSPEDQAILEAAYKDDPKPDKTARLELVKRVALGEKEVQIWFQNRRQSSRRKSRPLLPHEIAQYQRSRAAMQGSSPSSSLESSSPPHCEQDIDSHSRESTPPATERVEQISTEADATTQPDAPSTLAPTAASALPQPLGYLANRRRAASLYFAATEPEEPVVTATANPDRRIKKSASFVRLSLNAEGKAEVVTKDAASPSPPRPPQTLMPDVTPSTDSSNRLQRSYSGRSRDSRAWEFWCDKESRSEFEHTAEKDGSGSAAGAIGLLRTTSGRNILGSLSSKRNAPLSVHQANKRSKLDHKRPPLQRSNTSLGRLQGRPAESARHAPKLKHSESAAPLPGKGRGDSDKENMSPHSDAGPYERIRLSHVRPDRSGEGVGADPEQDEELSAFTRGGEQRKAGVAGDDDLDCVQGLLSLSQGNWR